MNLEALTVMHDKARDAIRKHESYRAKLYKCSEGFLTGGYGHKMEVGDEFSKEDWERHFFTDYFEAVDVSNRLCTEYGTALSLARQAIIINMAFNLGYFRLKNFKKMWMALAANDYELAAQEMIDSKWYVQTGGRARELVKCMRENKFPKGEHPDV